MSAGKSIRNYHRPPQAACFLVVLLNLIHPFHRNREPFCTAFSHFVNCIQISLFFFRTLFWLCRIPRLHRTRNRSDWAAIRSEIAIIKSVPSDLFSLSLAKLSLEQTNGDSLSPHKSASRTAPFEIYKMWTFQWHAGIVKRFQIIS